MKTRYMILLAVTMLPAVVGLVEPGTLRADDAMRCGRRLVSSGATSYEVRAQCGEPHSVQTRSEWRTIRRIAQVPCGPGTTATCSRVVDDVVEIQIEEWVYDFGRRRFMQHAIFEQGKLVRVEAGNRGVAK